MQRFLLTAGATFILMVFFFADGGYSRTSPTEFRLNIVQATPMPPPPTAEEIARRKDVALRWRVFWWGIVLSVVATPPALIFHFVITPWWHRRGKIMPNEQGVFPLLDMRRVTRNNRGEKERHRDFIDPNSFAGYGVSINGTVQDLASGMGRDAQIMATRGANTVRMMAAAHNSKSGGIKYASEAKLLAGYYDKPMQITETPIEAEAEPWSELSLRDAIKMSQPNKWIMGQSLDDGSLSIFDPLGEVHCAIIGKTGTGKTQSTAMLMLIYAKQFGMDVLILDGKFGVDWKPWARFVEWQEMTHQTIIAQLESLTELYMSRVELIQKSGVSHIDDVDGNHPHVFVMIEEFGAMCAALKATSRKTYNRMEVLLGELFSKARFTGLHICIMDQKPNKWAQSITANISSYFAYHMKGMLAQHIEVGLDQVPKVGFFQREGEVYRAWFTAGEMNAKTISLPRQSWRIIEPSRSIEEGGVQVARLLTPPPANRGSMLDYHRETPSIDFDSLPRRESKSNPGRDRIEVESNPKSNLIEPPLLSGQPTNRGEKLLVWNTYIQNSRSKNKTYKPVWGGESPERRRWLNEIIDEFQEDQ